MAKRDSEAVENGDQAYLKRQKIKHVASGSNATTVPTEDVQSSRQLQRLLAFDQDPGRAKQGIQSFKKFLEGVGDEDHPSNLAILKEYLSEQVPSDDDDKTATYLPELMQTWSFAAQSNNDHLLSAVPAVLALLLKTVSKYLELSPDGLRLGRTILQKQQLELIGKGLSTNKSKEFIIGPALRLLRELTIFDGGTLAKQVFRCRENTLKSLGRNLGLSFSGDGFEDFKKPSIRTHSMRFFLALIKFLPVEAKKELLNQRDIPSGVTRAIAQDPAYLVLETLDAIKTYVLQDDKLVRDAKSKLLNSSALGKLVTLYGYEHQSEAAEGQKSVEESIHEFLMLACTSNNLGILQRETGYYPRGVDPDAVINGRGLKDFIDLGLDSLEWADKFTDEVPVRNTVLSEFIQTLRPWSNMKQSELILAIFKAAPELVADYYFKKKSFSFEAKLTATWIGYSALLFSTVQLPVPQYFGLKEGYGRLAPPTSIVIESILPQPMTQKALARCLNQSSSLITFFAIRLLIVAFEKLNATLKLYAEASKESSLWDEAAIKLKEEFSRRCPQIKDAISTYRGISDDDLLKRHAASKLLVLYYECLPQIALESRFDASSALIKALELSKLSSASLEDSEMRTIEVENLFQIANCSPGMKWFNKADPLPISPFSAMLQLLSTGSKELPSTKIVSILMSVIRESGIMQLQTKISSLHALLGALKSNKEHQGTILEFLDNCALRCATTPVKYIDMLESHMDTSETVGTLPKVSLLLLAILEQWPFIVKAEDEAATTAIAPFVAQYYAASIKVGEDKKTIKIMSQAAGAILPEGSKLRKVIERSKKLVEDLELPTIQDTPVIDNETDETALQIVIESVKSHSLLEPTNVDHEDNSALHRWTTKEIPEVIEDGHLSSLITLLSSPHLNIRKEALINTSKFSAKLKESMYEEKQQIWLLLCELIETARPHINEPLPNTISAFAASSIAVIQDPLHFIYPKLNKFLSQGPTWELDKMPLLTSVLNETPSLDDAYYQEVEWMLTYLSSALRTPADMAIFHKRHVFEKLLSLYGNVYVVRRLKDMILRILVLATAVEGGSTTLVTRFSILSWLGAEIGGESDEGRKKLLKGLLDKILQTCDKDKVEKWSGKKERI